MSDQQVLDAAAARSAALVRRDWAAVERLLHAGFVYTNSQGARLDRAAYLDFLRDGPLRWNEQSFSDVRVVVAGDTAVLTGTVVDDVVVDGEQHLLRFATTQTYVLFGGAWSYLAGQTAPVS